jgi:hypothetical protein
MIVQRVQASGPEHLLKQEVCQSCQERYSHVYKMIRIACSVHVVDRVSAIVTQCICHCDKVS